jgi:hypothetical protein
MLADDDEQDLFEMSNLFPDTTGLPMTIWVSTRGHAQHDARVKVCMAHGPKMDISNTAVVGIRAAPWLITGSLTTPDRLLVEKWILANQDALIELWDGKIDGVQFAIKHVKI